MRHANELHESIRRLDLPGEGRSVERISDHRLAIRRETFLRALTNKGSDVVSSFDQARDQRTSDIPGATGDKNVLRGHSYPRTRLFLRVELWIRIHPLMTT